NEWVEIAMAIKSEVDSEVGFELFNNWSSLSEKYNQKDTASTWKSIRSFGKISIGTLFYRANENGWTGEQKVKASHHSSIKNNDRSYSVTQSLDNKEIKYQEMAALAKQIYDNSKEAVNDYLYLKRKKALAHGARVLNKDVSVFASGFGKKGHLIIPLLDTKGDIQSLLTILPSKKKDQLDKCFMRGARKSGCFYPIGTYQKDKPIIISEGFATASSIHQATGYYSIMGVDAGNLKPVTEALSKAYPNNRLMIACDNDQYKGNKNTGVEQAKKIAHSVNNTSIIIPEFKSLLSHPTDFNDLHQ
ncbi:PriCT-2 domain-containing protein, partial [Thiotrichales bacterium 19S9-12]|nr:PriCT-2 domain-containing protein [Thiotrichales bacterium 19S9-11]MCF6812622.1 PriCT-2 domain-containing protein [Thiotrichales bacterium 19S9-12]